MKALATMSTVVLCAACATSAPVVKEEAKPKPAAPVAMTVQQRVMNLIPFDVATCFPAKPALPAPLNAEAVAGALRAARPGILECLVDPKSRGAAPETVITLNGRTVTGTNLEESGKACIEKALAVLELAADAPEAPVEVRSSATGVKMGVNAASDVAGAIRLAQAQWCECYDGALPPSAMLSVHLTPGAPAKVAVKDINATTACLATKVGALDLRAPTETEVPYSFLLLDSRLETETPGTPNELQFLQLDAIRARKSAESALAVASRMTAVAGYDGLVAKYNATKKPAALVPEIKRRCAALVKADDALIAAIEAQAKIDTHTAELAATFAEKDEQWKNAQSAAQTQAQGTQAEAVKVKAARDSDAKVCPK